MFPTMNLFTLVLAIPAVLAAPATEAKAAAKQVVACACANDAGQTKLDGYCQYIAGGHVNLDGQSYCFPAATWSEYMETRFTADFCPGYYPGFPKPVCKTVTVCPTIGNYQDIC
ncbi:hypothetical protein FPSE_08798 [Fusarium pseudograminearum CS3096]|uniref:Uncharacterized protein n=1 Tax=Fusarium pseudograminearum (strain CS3096) TaxID=1028729 RepID=K3VEF4_FUSPC|nr:hypothetical protein FPSE_08798 [Fusarium pseudograminearum CS3096]EKJ71013.1 hypothetical protein FPSE_08798 [Fusarium pseudograminearum CS3096]KAF0636747.1 hypothetical protein FPSE5266_08798 [Fusarium pseudograminearum]